MTYYIRLFWGINELTYIALSSIKQLLCKFKQLLLYNKAYWARTNHKYNLEMGKVYGMFVQATVLSFSYIWEVPQTLPGTLPRFLQVTSSWLAPYYLSLQAHCTSWQQCTWMCEIVEYIFQPFMGVVNIVSRILGNVMVCIIFVFAQNQEAIFSLRRLRRKRFAE